MCSCLPFFFTAAHFYFAGLHNFSFSHFPFFFQQNASPLLFYLSFWLILCYPRPCNSNVTFDIDLHVGERTDGHVITKFSSVYTLPFSYPWCCF